VPTVRQAVALLGRAAGRATCDTIGPVKDYRVASHLVTRGAVRSEGPDGKRHAYLRGEHSTACGFGLAPMHLFPGLPFTDQGSAVRCQLCSRIVWASDR
jgi:hypothetical protein